MKVKLALFLPLFFAIILGLKILNFIRMQPIVILYLVSLMCAM